MLQIVIRWKDHRVQTTGFVLKPYEYSPQGFNYRNRHNTVCERERKHPPTSDSCLVCGK